MGYRTDQWYDLSSESSGENLNISSLNRNKAGSYLPDADNEKFIYPDRIVRTGSNAVGDRKLEFLKRGYIRSLQTAENKMGLPSRKCQFQFNPQYLVQSVSQNTTILNFLQQDPGQYAQPIPGNVSFSFELLFDRSMELNSTAPGVSSNATTGATNPWARSPYEVGVLHDINAFYSVIGVGLSDKMMDYAQKTLESQINAAAYTANEEAAANDSDGPAYSESDISDANSQASDFLKYNFGNTAFLLPLPVRVVFSSLYIVEGLVKDVTVTFTKFTSSMVPMQCTLNVLFEAKYVGFAQKDTFFTQVLEDYENLDPNSFSFDTDIDPDELQSYKDAILNDLSQAKMLVAFDDEDDSGRAYSHYTGVIDDGQSDQYSLTNMVSNASKQQFGSKQARDVEGNAYYFKVGFPGADGVSELARLADEGKEVSLDVSAQYSLWRWSDDVHEDLSDYWNKAAYGSVSPTTGVTYTEYGPAVSIQTTKPGTRGQRAAGREFFGKLWDWEASEETPSIKLANDDDGNERSYLQVCRISSAQLNSSTVVKNAKDSDNQDVEISLPSTGVQALEAAFDAGYTSKATLHSNGGYYDKSIKRTGDEENKIPQYRSNANPPSQFYLGFEYEIEVTVEIDGNQFPSTRVVDHIIIPVRGYGSTDDNGNGTYFTSKLVDIDWSDSFGDVDALIEDAEDDDDDGGSDPPLTALDPGFIAVT
jgi:hypothetical protein